MIMNSVFNKDNYNIKKEEIIFWDDNKENVSSANKFGIKSFQYTSIEEFNKTMKKLIKF